MGVYIKLFKLILLGMLKCIPHPKGRGFILEQVNKRPYKRSVGYHGRL